MLYKFENDQKKFGCVGSYGYAPASVNLKAMLPHNGDKKKIKIVKQLSSWKI